MEPLTRTDPARALAVIEIRWPEGTADHTRQAAHDDLVARLGQWGTRWAPIKVTVRSQIS
jgi:hypothetical protein